MIRVVLFNYQETRTSLFPAVPTKTMVHVVALTVFLPFLVKDPSSLKKDNLSSTHPLHIVPPLRQPSFHLLTPPRFGALNLPEVNQFTGNCFRMVRIVLKITFLKLRYPKGVTGRVPLCPIMAIARNYSGQKTTTVREAINTILHNYIYVARWKLWRLWKQWVAGNVFLDIPLIKK